MNIRFLVDLHNQIRSTRTAFNVPKSKGKAYPRFEQITLPNVTEIATPLSHALETRVSTVNPMQGEQMKLSELSNILGHSMRIREDGHRPHPSGGARFPLEAYVFAFSVENLPRSTYHYQPLGHKLERLWDLSPEASLTTYLSSTADVAIHKSSVLILLAARWEASAIRYSSFAFELTLMEAGHIMQNLILTSTGLNIASRPSAGFIDELISKTLELDPDREQLIYALALGK